jgi:hypothetical protein
MTWIDILWAILVVTLSMPVFGLCLMILGLAIRYFYEVVTGRL